MSDDFYETDHAVAEYLLFHYGSPAQVLPYAFGPTEALGFPARCVGECLDPTRLGRGARALDLGCAVGRSAFELARHCEQVVGIDYSRRFIDTARNLRDRGSIEVARVEEGELTTPITVTVPAEVERRRVSFEQGDAQALRADLGVFDVVLMANLIDRLQDPRRCLAQLPRLLRPEGQLIITSPYTWLAEYTPKPNWLGGVVRENRPVWTRQTLQMDLAADFELVQVKDLPLLIREHARKFQWSVAEATLWVRK